jgi:selenocysteine lyase/cysteine desulfurase
MEFPMRNHPNISTVLSGRIFLFAAMPATLWLANFHCPRGTKSDHDLRPVDAPARILFFNTQVEVDRFVEVVKEIQKFFGQ